MSVQLCAENWFNTGKLGATPTASRVGLRTLRL